jgi:hypothetical protein
VAWLQRFLRPFCPTLHRATLARPKPQADVSRLAAVKHSAAIRPVFTVLIAFPMVPLIKWRQNKQRVPLIGGFSRRGFWHSIGLIVL